jgi:hypothetical protein
VEKEEIQLSLFTDGTVVSKEHPKESTTKNPTWSLVRDYREVSGYKVNMKKSPVFLHNSNGQVGFEMKKTTPFNQHLLHFGSNIPQRSMCQTLTPQVGTTEMVEP